MKKKSHIIKGSLNLLYRFLIALAPTMLQNTNCFLMWGEPKCPDDLLELYSEK